MRNSDSNRRHILRLSLAAGIAAVSAPTILRPASAAPDAKRLNFHHLHTDEKLTATYWSNGAYDRGGCADIDQVLRDWRRDEAVPIDRALLDHLHQISISLNTDQPFQVICGYRAPKTNTDLRNQGRGVAKRSLHMQGRAIDIAMSGVSAADLHQTAVSLKAGGVGLYSKSGFIHVDTGRVRYWGA